MKLLIVTCLLAYAVTQPVSQLEDRKEIDETANKITENFDGNLPTQDGEIQSIFTKVFSRKRSQRSLVWSYADKK